MGTNYSSQATCTCSEDENDENILPQLLLIEYSNLKITCRALISWELAFRTRLLKLIQADRALALIVNIPAPIAKAPPLFNFNFHKFKYWS